MPTARQGSLLGDLTAGPYYLTVSFSGYGQYGGAQAETSFTVLRTAAVVLVADRTSAVQGERPVMFSAVVSGHDGWSGTVTLLEEVAGSVVELGPVAYTASDGKAAYSTSALRVGTHSIRARFNGIDGVFVPALSEPIALTVAADTSVHATFKPSASTFYAYKDGYRDTVSLGGILDETATVTIRVYSSSGSIKRTFSLGKKPIGSYSATWNGRTAAGTAVASGRYTVRASFKDAKGHTRTITGSTTVSWRQVTWKNSGTTVRYGSQFTYYATPGDHLFYSDDYERGRVLYSADIDRDCDPCQTVYGYTTFSLTSVALAYRSVKVTVTGHGFVDYNSGDAFFVTWSTNTPRFKGALPEYLSQPMTYAATPSSNVSADRKVRFGAWCSEDMGDAFDLHFVKFHYQYAVWKS